jgi:hypothetical protein
MIPLPIKNEPMANSDLLVLDDILKQEKALKDPQASDSEFFAAGQVLRDFSLDPDDINSGIVGQESNKDKEGTDGGIDSVYLLVNGTPIRDVEQAKSLSNHKQNITFDTYARSCAGVPPRVACLNA